MAARAARSLRLLMQIQVYRHLYCSRAGPRQLLVPVEPELPPSLAVPMLDRSGPVQSLAGQRLRRRPLPWRVRAARALRLLMQIQVYRHPYRSWAGPRQLLVLDRFGAVPPLAGLRQLLQSSMKRKPVEQPLYRS
jgi:hypothetical protein